MSPVRGSETQGKLFRAQRVRFPDNKTLPFTHDVPLFLPAGASVRPPGVLEQRVGWDRSLLFLNALGRGWGHHTSSVGVNPLPQVSLDQDCVWGIKHNWAEKEGTSEVFRAQGPHI